ncbi:MAG TPA: mechanosensitive ion channel [Methanoregula sp.]|nr:mechanosensitive ion channel [Methanoregula sp.]
MEMNILYAAITIIAGFTLAVIAYLVIGWLTKRAEQTETRLDDIILAAVSKPIVVIIIALSIYSAIILFDVLPSSLGWFETDKVVSAFFIIINAWVASVFSYNVFHIYGGMLAQKTDTDLNKRLFPMLEVIVKYVIWFIAIMLVLTEFQVDITPLLAGAGIAGIALALAAQDIIGNFFGGAIIAIDKPFKMGDRIKIDSFIGDVVQVGPRSTRIKTSESMIITIPNKKVAESIVINYAMPDLKLKVSIPFSVAYGSGMKNVRKILLEIALEAAEKTPWVIDDPAPSVYFLEFGESSLNGQLLLWISDYNKTWEVKDWVIGRIEERFAEEGIEIPYRQIDVRLRDRKNIASS